MTIAFTISTTSITTINPTFFGAFEVLGKTMGTLLFVLTIASKNTTTLESMGGTMVFA
jgi:hypothetical protein